MRKDFMLAALDQAWLGRGICSPNPSVGAVLVHNQQIVAKAFHPGVGLLHAEQLVLNQLPAGGLTDLTLYVTLEPCNHWGRTPPCVDAIINHRIKKVVFAYCDPNPLVVKNNTPHILQEKGIEVNHFPLPEIDLFYQSYKHWFDTKTPWVTAKIAQSLDGKVAGLEGKKLQLSNAECAKFTHEQRLYTDVILTTARTILADNPFLNVRLNDMCDLTINNRETGKVLAIIDRQLQLTGRELVFSKAKQCLIFHDESLPISQKIDKCSYHAVPVVDGQLCLVSVIKILGEIGFHDVWVEAGGKLFGALHALRLVNRTYIYLVPKVVGEQAVSAYHNDQFFENKHQINWQAKLDNMVMQVEWDLGG